VIRARALDVEFAQVRAPISGRISDVRVDRGNLVQGGSMGEPTLLTTIVSVDPIQFEFDGSEAIYLKYQRQNQAGTRGSSRQTANPVEIRLQDDPGYTIRGRMDFVDNALDRGSGTIRGRAIVPNPDGFLTPGMFGRLRLLGSGAYRALLVPDSAVVTDQTRKMVMTVAANGTVEPKLIELGPMTDGLRIIRSGLAPTDRVIIAGLQRVRPGDKATARPGRIVPPTVGTPSVQSATYSAPPAASASNAGAGR
jgi:RND family efflux transporter MFP subunit